MKNTWMIEPLNEGQEMNYVEDDEPPTDAELADLEASELDLQEEE